MFEEEAYIKKITFFYILKSVNLNNTHQNVLLFVESSGVSEGLSRFIVPAYFIKRKVPLMVSVNLFQAAYLRPIHCKSGAS